MRRDWVAFFSQTGSELKQICDTLGRRPDAIVTNNTNHPLFPQAFLLSNQPPSIQYRSILKPGDLVTLHGWLRIVPPDICNMFEIYNGHPGLIIPEFYPELKGKDPQKRAWSKKHPIIGCVIHKVTPKIDDGEIVASTQISNTFETEEELVDALHNESIKLWINFLKNKI